jgi:hypothetical protein
VTGTTRFKLAAAVIGLLLFAAGVRMDDARLRYIAIGFVTLAWFLRLVKPRSGPALPPDRDGSPHG